MTSLKYPQQQESYPAHNCSRMNDTIFTKELLKRLEKYNDDEEISLQESIPILYDLNIFQQLTSIPEAKKRLTQDSRPNNRLQLQARFVYNLWKIISQEFIPMRQFKEIITLFITEEISDLAIKLEEIFENQDDSLVQILAIWEGMLESNSHQSSYQDFKDSSVLTDQEANLNQSRESHNHRKSSSQYSSNNYSTNQMQRNRSSLNKREKENDRQSVVTNSKVYTERHVSKTRRQNIEDVKNQMYISNLYELPVLSLEKEKELVNRLYVVNKYDRYEELKKIQDEQKISKQMEQCTFRPNIDKNKKTRPDSAQRNQSSRAQNRPIPGYEKAVQRMKIGQQKTKELKQKLELRKMNVKQVKQENLRAMVPPKFLTRETKKEQKRILFTIQFDIGRHKLTCKIGENESAQQLARNIQSIYSLKQDSYEQIKQIIQQQIERYFELNKNPQNQQQDLEDQEEVNEPEQKIDGCRGKNINDPRAKNVDSSKTNGRSFIY